MTRREMFPHPCPSPWGRSKKCEKLCDCLLRFDPVPHRSQPPTRRAISSVGRAPRLHRGCREFESLIAHQLFFMTLICKADLAFTRTLKIGCGIFGSRLVLFPCLGRIWLGSSDVTLGTRDCSLLSRPTYLLTESRSVERRPPRHIWRFLWKPKILNCWK